MTTPLPFHSAFPMGPPFWWDPRHPSWLVGHGGTPKKNPWDFPWVGITETGWWFGTMDFSDFPWKIGNFIIPTDELIFFRGVGIPPTSKIMDSLSTKRDFRSGGVSTLELQLSFGQVGVRNCPFPLVWWRWKIIEVARWDFPAMELITLG